MNDFEDLSNAWGNQKMKDMDYKKVERQVLSTRERIHYGLNVNEQGYIAISVIASIILFATGSDTVFNYLTISALLIIGVLIYWNRITRLKKQKDYEQTVLGDLDHAISNMKYIVKRARTYSLWYVLPLAIPSLLNMYYKGVSSPLQWALVVGCFILGFSIIQVSLVRKYIPKLQKLEKMREDLIETI